MEPWLAEARVRATAPSRLAQSPRQIAGRHADMRQLHWGGSEGYNGASHARCGFDRVLAGVGWT